MQTFAAFIRRLPDISNPASFGIASDSIHHTDDTWAFIASTPAHDVLVVYGKHAESFAGITRFEAGIRYQEARLTSDNAKRIRALFPFAAPVPILREARTFGLGDRLGIAGEGHLRVFKTYDAKPMLAQQSIRELNMTKRSYEDVLAAATFAVFKAGYKGGYGADGDHLKTPEEVKMALDLGMTMITLDCSDHIRKDVLTMAPERLHAAVTLDEEMQARYLDKTFEIEDVSIYFDRDELLSCQLIYGEAINFTHQIHETFFKDEPLKADFELSIDETETPTTPANHFFVANELSRRGVVLATLAPRFCGEFQKGVDYVGNLEQFETELKAHAAIARHFGYKLSIHSGSDKFSIFTLIGSYTHGRFHVKTAGTNWLEAMRVTAMTDPKLYREIHAYALSMFEQAKAFYHVTTDINRIPTLETLGDAALPDLFEHNDARQLIHITYGFILTATNTDGSMRFKNRLEALWRTHAKVYANRLETHIGKHLSLLYAGFENQD